MAEKKSKSNELEHPENARVVIQQAESNELEYPENAKFALQQAIDRLKEIKEEQPADSISVIVLKKAILRAEVSRDNIK